MNETSAQESLTPSHADDAIETLVRGRADELFGLASHLQNSHEEQNRRIARELHDELGSLLTAAKLDITFIKSKCAKTAPELVAKCDRIASMIDQAAALKRRMIDELRPSTLDMLGLGPALRELLDAFSAETAIKAVVDIDDDDAPSGAPSLVVYRVVESALASIRTHADAANLLVRVSREGNVIALRIADDHSGDAAQNAQRNGGDVVKRGALDVDLAGIRQRIAAAGGRVSFAATPQGSVIEATLPANDASA